MKSAPTRRAKRGGGRGLYSPHPSIRLVQHWAESLTDKTGRSLDEWLAHIERAGPATEAARRAWLTDDLKLPTNTAWWLAERSVGKGAEDADPAAYLRACPAMVDAMYAGKRAALRPIHDALVTLGRSIGPDVKVCPCQTIVPLFRRYVIAQIKPASHTRIDFGLALGDPAKVKGAPARLLETGGFAKKDRITHRFAITRLEEIDATVERWLRRAYERDA